MTPTPSDIPADEANQSSPQDLRAFFDQPQAWAGVSQGLQRIALAIVGDEREAEDVVQGAWLEVLKNPRREQSQGWLRRLVRFRALDALRSRRRDPVQSAGELPESDEPAAPDMRWKLEAQREVLDAVQELEEPYLSTILLRYFEGKGPAAIAQHLGVPERTVKTRLTRAHAKLRARLGERYQDRFGNWAPALVAFSGLQKLDPKALGLTASGATLGTSTGLLLMKKAMLIVAVLAAVVLVPLALNSSEGEGEGLASADSTQTEGPLVEPLAVEPPDATPKTRELLVEESPTPSPPEAPFEYAFPPKAEAQVGSLAVRVRWSDGTLASGMKLSVHPFGVKDGFLMERTAYTNAQGYALIEQLAPGEAKVRFSRAKDEVIEIYSGQQSLLEVQAALGVHIRGTILNPSGQPVPGALVFLADSAGGDRQPLPSAVADGKGEYYIRDVKRHHYLSARAPGYAPSLQVETGGDPGNTVQVDLNLRENPGTLTGIALSPAGKPVFGAKIKVVLIPRLPEDFGFIGEDGRVRQYPLAFEMQTDEGGRFYSELVGSGTMRVMARTENWQPWEQRVEVEPGGSQEVTIQFEPGLELSGVVRDEQGRPIPKAHVLSGRHGEAHSVNLYADEMGAFRVGRLPSGVVDFRFYKKGFATAAETVALSAETPNHIEVTLTKMDSVRGVVVDAEGEPLERWLVVVESRTNLWVTSAWTDSNGEFELLGIPEGTTDLVVTTEQFMESATRHLLPSILPATGPLRIVVPDSAQPKSSVRLKVMVDGEPAPREARVRLSNHREVYPDSQGIVHMENLASREYRIEVVLAGYAPLHKRFQLGVAEDLDLGTLHLQPGGRIQVQVDGPGSEEVMYISLIDERGEDLAFTYLQKGQGVTHLVPPGMARLRLNGAGGATQFAEVEVHNGEVAHARFQVRPGTGRVLQISRKSGEPARASTRVRITNSKGQVQHYSEDVSRQQREQGKTLLLLSGLEIGRYEVQVIDPTGPTQVIPLQITSLDRLAGDPIPIQLDW